MADPTIEPVTELLAAAEEGNPPNNNLSIEALILLINTERLNYLKEQTRKELDELKGRQEKVKTLHKLLRAINKATDDKGKLDIAANPEIKDLIKSVKDLGVDIKEGKLNYTKEERDRLVENIRITADDHNVENDMQLQTISRLTNERYETYQMARSILKPLHDDKMRKAREVAGKS
jgi:hypothetical protein